MLYNTLKLTIWTPYADRRKQRMHYSGSYVVVETIIRQNKIVFSELEQLTATLQRRGLLHARERNALLDLGKRILPGIPAERLLARAARPETDPKFSTNV
jgi:hypothetical protein